MHTMMSLSAMQQLAMEFGLAVDLDTLLTTPAPVRLTPREQRRLAWRKGYGKGTKVNRLDRGYDKAYYGQQVAEYRDRKDMAVLDAMMEEMAAGDFLPLVVEEAVMVAPSLAVRRTVALLFPLDRPVVTPRGYVVVAATDEDVHFDGSCDVDCAWCLFEDGAGRDCAV